MSQLIKVACLSLLLLSLGSANGLGRPQSRESAAVQENLNAAEAWDAAFNSEDVDAVMALYAEGAVSMPPGFLPLIGKPSIKADYEFVFENFNLHHQTTVVQLEVQGAMAVERGKYGILP